jgi:hypothetical protein
MTFPFFLNAFAKPTNCATVDLSSGSGAKSFHLLFFTFFFSHLPEAGAWQLGFV